MKRWVVRLVIALAVLGGLAALFLQSVRSTRSAPYAVAREHLQPWTLALEPGGAVLLAARAPRELAASLFRQLFTRHAESFNGPNVPSIPLVLRDEFSRSFAGAIAPEALLELARASGLEGSAMTPRCMAYRRDSAPGVTRQLYFLVFDAPAFTAFRTAAAARALPESGFDPAALSPAMIVAASDTNFTSWLPLRVSEDECIASVE